MMVQPSLHGHMTLVNSVEMPTPTATFTLADANHFLVNGYPACHFVAGMAISDTNAIFGQPLQSSASHSDIAGAMSVPAVDGRASIEVGPPRDAAVKTGRWSDTRSRRPRFPTRARKATRCS